LGQALFLGGIMYVIYLAVEPYIRRSWPKALMSWTRLLSGRLRDAFIGRDLLIGAAAGMAMTFLDRFEQFLPGAAGWPERMPVTQYLSALLGLRGFGATALTAINAGIQNGLISVLLLGLLRAFVQIQTTRWKFQRFSVDAVTFFVAITVVTLFTVLDYTGNTRYMWLPLLTSELTLIITLLLVARVGVLAATIAFIVNFLVERIPITFDGSRFYAGQGWVVVLAILVLAGLGFRWARAGEPAFGAPSQ
jgi:serine/threonine-protein kinase